MRVVCIDGKAFQDHCMVIAFGIDVSGSTAAPAQPAVPPSGADRYRNDPRLRHLEPAAPRRRQRQQRALTTKTLLISCLTAGGTNNGPRLVAYDKAVDLPSGGIGTPMTGRRAAVHRADGRGWAAPGAVCVARVARCRNGCRQVGDRIVARRR